MTTQQHDPLFDADAQMRKADECDDDFEDDYIDDEYDEFKPDCFGDALSRCSMIDMLTGDCGAAGSEECEFECPIRKWWERGDFDDDEDVFTESGL